VAGLAVRVSRVSFTETTTSTSSRVADANVRNALNLIRVGQTEAIATSLARVFCAQCSSIDRYAHKSDVLIVGFSALACDHTLVEVKSSGALGRCPLRNVRSDIVVAALDGSFIKVSLGLSSEVVLEFEHVRGVYLHTIEEVVGVLEETEASRVTSLHSHERNVVLSEHEVTRFRGHQLGIHLVEGNLEADEFSIWVFSQVLSDHFLGGYINTGGIVFGEHKFMIFNSRVDGKLQVEELKVSLLLGPEVTRL